MMHNKGVGYFPCAMLAVIAAGSSEHNSSGSRALIVGSTGSGMTYFCNFYDGTYCGSEDTSLKSVTSEVYVGANFIVAGSFGYNDVQNGEEMTSTMLEIRKTLTTLQESSLNSVIWMVNCLELRPTRESIDAINLVVDMIGRNVPLVVVLNPCGADMKCRMRREGLIPFLKDRGLNVRETILFDDFNLADYKARYSTSYQVILPEDFQQKMFDIDPKALAKWLRIHREQQCETLPARLEAVRSSLDACILRLLSESSIPSCDIAPRCDHISDRTRECHTSMIGATKDSDGNAVYVDEESIYCRDANEAKLKIFQAELRNCSDSFYIKHEECEEKRKDKILMLRKQNAGIEEECNQLLAEEQKILTRCAVCHQH